MRRELGQLPTLLISNPINNPPIIYQLPRPNYQSNVPPRNPQLDNAKVILKLKNYRILINPYQD